VGERLRPPEHHRLALGLLIGLGEQAVSHHIELDTGAVHAAHVVVGVVALAHVPATLIETPAQLAKVVAQVSQGVAVLFSFSAVPVALLILWPSLG
jgi:hypothetical protein